MSDSSFSNEPLCQNVFIFRSIKIDLRLNAKLEIFTKDDFHNQWCWSITGQLLFTHVMTQKSELYRFLLFEINFLAEIVYLIIFCPF